LFSHDLKEDESMEDYVTCPACEVDVVLPDHTLLGELVKCSRCGAQFEVLSLGPFIPSFQGKENWGGPQSQVPGSSAHAASAGYLN
jgi:lysine biosynthesis protein LysW